ncbi:hypothetical protein ACN47E_004911 [Coniothyrium glycines]
MSVAVLFVGSRETTDRLWTLECYDYWLKAGIPNALSRIMVRIGFRPSLRFLPGNGALLRNWTITLWLGNHARFRQQVSRGYAFRHQRAGGGIVLVERYISYGNPGAEDLLQEQDRNLP